MDASWNNIDYSFKDSFGKKEEEAAAAAAAAAAVVVVVVEEEEENEWKFWNDISIRLALTFNLIKEK